MYESSSLAIEPMLGDNVVLAARFNVCGLRLILAIGEPSAVPITWVFHPTAIILRARAVDKRLVLSWNGTTPESDILCERTGEFDGPPPDWREWEKVL